MTKTTDNEGGKNPITRMTSDIPRNDAEAAADEIIAHAAGRKLGSVTIRELIDERRHG